MHVIGIDGGQKGAIASIYFTEGSNFDLSVHRMPTIHRLVGGKSRPRVDAHVVREILLKYREISERTGDCPIVFIEQPVGLPRQSAARACEFGYSVGEVAGVAVGIELPVRLVRADAWKRWLSLLGKDKAASIDLATMLFPANAAQLTQDGQAEAALIAWYGCSLIAGVESPRWPA